MKNNKKYVDIASPPCEILWCFSDRLPLSILMWLMDYPLLGRIHIFMKLLLTLIGIFIYLNKVLLFNKLYCKNLLQVANEHQHLTGTHEVKAGWSFYLILAGVVTTLGSSLPVGFNIGVVNTPADVIKKKPYYIFYIIKFRQTSGSIPPHDNRILRYPI